MTAKSVLIVGSGHLAYRVRKLAVTGGYDVKHLGYDVFRRGVVLRVKCLRLPFAGYELRIVIKNPVSVHRDKTPDRAG